MSRLVLRITRRELLDADACEEGQKLFDEIKAMQDEERTKAGRKPRRALRLRWSLLEQLWLATAYPAFAGWLVDVGVIPSVHGRRANLYGANLYGANLYGANLYGANLYGANLYGANLDGANLYGANLYGANLYGANLYGANLYGANLYGANLYGANLDGANLYGANLYGANLYGANLYGANLYGANLYGANLDGARGWPSAVPLPAGWRLAGCGCCLERAPALAPPDQAPAEAAPPAQSQEAPAAP